MDNEESNRNSSVSSKRMDSSDHFWTIPSRVTEGGEIVQAKKKSVINKKLFIYSAVYDLYIYDLK